MTRFSIMLTIVFVIVLGTILFCVKYNVNSLAQRNHSLKNKISTTEESVNMLRAEYAYLSRANRIRKLIKKHLPRLKTARSDQVITLEQLCSGREEQKEKEGKAAL